MRIDPRQIKIGTRIELEHTRSRRVARRIALDHLREFFPVPYYAHHVRLERRLKRLQRSAIKRLRRRGRNPDMTEIATTIGTGAVTSGASRLLGLLGAGAIMSRLGKRRKGGAARRKRGARRRSRTRRNSRR